MALATLSSASQDGRLAEKLSEVQQTGTHPSAPQIVDSSEQVVVSPRQQELLAQHKSLVEQQRDMQRRLDQFPVDKSHVPVPPAANASAKQRPGAALAFRELREVHSSLTTENQRLNAELARLLARASSASTMPPPPS